MIVNWTFLEGALTYWCITIYHDVGGKDKSPTIPRNYRRKVDFLRRCFRQIGALAPFSAEAIKILDEMDRLAFVRNFVAHGTVTGYDPDSRKITFVKLDPVEKSTIHEASELYATLGQLSGAADECMECAGASQRLAGRLVATFMPGD